MTADEQRQKCDNCEYMSVVTGGRYRSKCFKFRGCFCEPYKGKWCLEIDKCPKEEGEEE